VIKMNYTRQQYYSWEAGLGLGAIVEARFTNNNRYYRFPARIIKINNSTFRVESIESFDTQMGGNYDKGHIFVIQRNNYGYGSKTWSSNNGVFPI